jgi:integrase/recombinase XerD
MPQAKTITDAEFELLLKTVSRGRHAHRNQLLLEFLHWAGMRVGKVANLRVSDVADLMQKSESDFVD